MEGAKEILLKMEENQKIVMQKFADGEKRFDIQDKVIADIQDQIKGNEDKGIAGIRPMLKEHQKVLVVPMLIARIPKPFLIGIIVIMIEGILEMAHAGLITSIIAIFAK